MLQHSRWGSTRVAIAPARGIAVVAVVIAAVSVDATARCSVRALLLLQACTQHKIQKTRFGAGEVTCATSRPPIPSFAVVTSLNLGQLY